MSTSAMDDGGGGQEGGTGKDSVTCAQVECQIDPSTLRGPELTSRDVATAALSWSLNGVLATDVLDSTHIPHTTNHFFYHSQKVMKLAGSTAENNIASDTEQKKRKTIYF